MSSFVLCGSVQGCGKEQPAGSARAWLFPMVGRNSLKSQRAARRVAGIYPPALGSALSPQVVSV